MYVKEKCGLCGLVRMMREEELKKSMSMINKYNERFATLRRMERTLSVKSDQLLKDLKCEEGRTNHLQGYVDRTRETHERLLGGITAPSWLSPSAD